MGTHLYSLKSNLQINVKTINQQLNMGDRGDRSVFVGNLNFRATEDDIGHMFSQFGNVLSVRIVTDRDTGRPRGFGFVEYDSPECVDQAIQNLNGQDMMGRQLRLDRANKRN